MRRSDAEPFTMHHLPRPLQVAALCAAFLAGIGELAKLQGWRLRERLRPPR